MSYELIKKFLFKLEAEDAHNLVIKIGKIIQRFPPLLKLIEILYEFNHPSLKVEVLNLSFPNPIGLAAGFDKNGEIMRVLEKIGFGFVEIGTITPKPQSGNPRPRLKRFVDIESIQNSFGFNNVGFKKALENYKEVNIPVGVNIGKNKTQTNPILDYIFLVKNFTKGNFFVINISSPNTPGLRELQDFGFLDELLKEIKKIKTKPILIKLSPDIKIKKAIELSTFAIENGADGVVATNTTNDYSLLGKRLEIDGLGYRGGLSGKILNKKSFEFFKELAKELAGKTTLISVGGISSIKDVEERLKVGANLIEIYSALIFQGPGLIKRLKKELALSLE